ncbi:lanC-like protein 2 [Dendronephthya gigantea]|uniref:lanC-like protein 2 n=1 Tax=Dendronephthya gigantea TaxID=151771 RepID=UPI00106C0282|nr:lanC-like protein 2 [Dendronephthya gigantea]
MSERREFDNPFNEEIGEQVLTDDAGKVSEPWHGLLKANIEKYLQQLENGLKHTDPNDYSVYTGSSGIALLYYKLSSTAFCQSTNNQQQLLSQASHILESSLPMLKGRRHTFLCGDAGVYALSAVLYSKLGKTNKCETYIEKLCAMCEVVVSDRTLPDEMLYGRAGYLYSLLFVQTHLGKEVISSAIVEQVVSAILKSGLALSRKEKSRSPLKYAWHGKHYVGAAHGMVGILYMLLQVYPSSPVVQQHTTEIKNTIEYLLSKQFSSGNFPSSLENDSDRLIHWCHGAPGAVYLMLKAYQLFKDKRYLDTAILCGDVVWKRGLLRKGYGICHGVSGNAYTFLALYKQTGDQLYLHRALKFAEWTFSYGEHNCRTPDTPYSLFEGLAGTLYFWLDLFEPQKSLFPAFEL